MNQNDLFDGKSADESIQVLEAEMAAFGDELEAAKKAVLTLRATERPLEGVVYAQEIFQNQQNKLRLETEIEIRRRRINRIRCSVGDYAPF